MTAEIKFADICAHGPRRSEAASSHFFGKELRPPGSPSVASDPDRVGHNLYRLNL